MVAGYRLKRADPFIRTAYARAYRLALNIFYRLGVRDVDCAFKLFKRSALEGIRLESGGAFMSAELLIKLKQRGRTIAEVGRAALPAHGRLADGRQANGHLPRRSATSGACASGCGSTAPTALKRGEPVAAG